MESKTSAVTCESSPAAVSRSKQKMTPLQRSLVVASAGVPITILVIAYPFVSGALRRHFLPYLPATDLQLSNVRSLLSKHRPPHKYPNLVDIGSGDGRVVIACAREGYKAVGIELNPWLVLFSRLSAWRSRQSARATFRRADLWKSDFSRFDTVIFFGTESPTMMRDLREKLERELRVGSAILVCRFPLLPLVPTASAPQIVPASPSSSTSTSPSPSPASSRFALVERISPSDADTTHAAWLYQLT